MESIKERIEHYWSHRAEAFLELRLREFEDEKHDLWLAELRSICPKGGLCGSWTWARARAFSPFSWLRRATI